MFKLKLISRYLLARRITVVPILAVAVAVFLLIVVLAVLNGFGSFIQEKIRGTLSDVIVEYDDVRGFEGYEELSARLAKLPGVRAVSPHLSGKGLLTISGGQPTRAYDFPCVFIGVDLDAENSVTRLRDFIVEGRAFEWAETDLGLMPPVPVHKFPGLILGNEVLSQFRDVPLGYPVALTTPTAFDEDSSMDLRITSKFKTGLYEYDRTTVYIPLAEAQQLMRLPGRVTSLHLRTDRGADLEALKAGVRAQLGGRKHFVVKTWMESEKVLIDAMRLERVIWVVILSAMLAVAGFCILAVMGLTVIQKTRDIGILRSMGASVGGILATFVQYGFVAGLIGSTLGLAGGYLALHNLNAIEAFSNTYLHWTPWPREVFYFKEIPCDISWPAMLTFWAWGVAVALAASLIPAMRAARTRAVRTLRYEH